MNENKQLNDSASKVNVQTADDRLRSFCEAVEKRFPLVSATHSIESNYIVLTIGGQDIEYVGDNSDLANAEWIVWGLEALDKLDCKPNLYPNAGGSHTLTAVVYNHKFQLTCVDYKKGPNRSIVVFNALCAALGVSDSVGGG